MKIFVTILSLLLTSFSAMGESQAHLETFCDKNGYLLQVLRDSNNQSLLGGHNHHFLNSGNTKTNTPTLVSDFSVIPSAIQISFRERKSVIAFQKQSPFPSDSLNQVNSLVHDLAQERFFLDLEQNRIVFASRLFVKEEQKKEFGQFFDLFKITSNKGELALLRTETGYSLFFGFKSMCQ